MMRLLHGIVAAALAHALFAQPLRFQHISTTQGLSDNDITALCQDKAGFLWIGTRNGLNRYDGRHFETWHRADGLAGEQVTAILQDRLGTIWVAAEEGGLTRFSPSGKLQTSYRPDAHDPAAMADVRINCLYDLNDSTLLIGARKTPLLFLDKRTGRFSYWKGDGPIRPAAALAKPPAIHEWCLYLADIDRERFAVGILHDRQQFIVDRATGAIEPGHVFKLSCKGVGDLEDQTITVQARVGDTLYGGGWQKHLHLRCWSTGEEDTLALPDECTTLLALDRNHLLVGTKASGLFLLDLRNGTLSPIHHRTDDLSSLSDDRVEALLKDRDGGVWVGTRNGLNHYAPSRWRTTSIPLHRRNGPAASQAMPFRIEELPGGRTILCTTVGLFLQDGPDSLRQLKITDGRRTLRTTCLLPAGDGFLLGAEEGLFRWNGHGRTAAPISPAVYESAQISPKDMPKGEIPALFQVRSLLRDTLMGRPLLIAGVRGYGIAILDPERHVMNWYSNTPLQPLSIGNNLTNKVVRDRDGTYWVATDHGLYQWLLDRDAPANRFRAFLANSPNDPLPANEVIDLLADGRGMLWIATRNGGLAAWDGHRMQYFHSPMPGGNSVFGLALDRRGRLWCAVNGGFAVLDTLKRTWHYRALPGGQDMPVVPLCMRSLQDGRIAFVADGALQFLDPVKDLPPVPPPLPYLTGLKLGDHSVLDQIHDGVLHLGPGEDGLHVMVSALDLNSSSAYRFTLELEDEGRAPRFVDEAGNLVYGSLPSGTYRLLARTVSPDGSSPPVVLATIHKDAPAWQQWWFYLGLALLAGTVAYIFSRYRYRQRLKLEQVRIRIASDLHDEVGSSLSAITLGSQLAAKLSHTENRQVQDLMKRIGETSSASLRSMSAIIWAIDPKHDEGDALVRRMRRVAQDLLGGNGIKLTFSTLGDVEDIRLKMDARKELILLYKEAIHNCSKHSGANEVQVELRRRDNQLNLRVQDNGKGFDPGLHPDGHGLGSMARRAEALGSTLRLTSATGKGTCVELELNIARLRD
jgi:signal transduction histidine kinase/ligand-binding sensor domain-containing protein